MKAPAKAILKRFTYLTAVTMLISLPLHSIRSLTVMAQSSGNIVGNLANDYLTVDLYANGAFRARLSSDIVGWITFPCDTGTLSLNTGQAEYRLYPEPTKGIAISRHLMLKANEAEMTWMVDGLRVVQRLRLLAESIHIIFEITNLRSTENTAKLRLLVDTQLFSNDGAPIYVEGYGIFTHEAFFTFPGNLTFTGWWACVSPEDTFRSVCNMLTRPYKLAFAYWGTAKTTVFEYQTDPGRMFSRPGHLKSPESDSCVLMYFNLDRLQPGIPQTITITYGVP